MDYLILNTSGLIVNLIKADPDFTLDDGLTKVLESEYPTAATGDSIIDGIVIPATKTETDEEKSDRIVAGADEIYFSQTLENQAAFSPIYIGAKYFSVRGKFDLAAAIITSTEVPPELESVKDQLLALLT